MEELRGEAQSLAAPQRVALVEADRAVVLVFQVLQRVGQRGVGCLPGALCQIARQVAHGGSVERRRFLGARHAAECGGDGQSRALQQDVAPSHRVSPGIEDGRMGVVSARDWGEMMPFKRS